MYMCVCIHVMQIYSHFFVSLSIGVINYFICSLYIYYHIYIPNLHISDCLLYTWESLLDMDVITNGYILYDNYLLLLLVICLGMSENGAYPSNSQFQWEKT